MPSEYIAHISEDLRIQTVYEHLKNVSFLCSENGKKIGMGSLACIIGLLHDIGKNSEEFKQYIGSKCCDLNALYSDEEERLEPGEANTAKKRGDVDHSTSGAQYISKLLSAIGGPYPQIAAICIASHHNSLIDCLKPNGQDEFSRRMLKEDKLIHLSEAITNTDPELLQYAKAIAACPEIKEELSSIQNALLEPNESKQVKYLKYGLLTRYLFSCLIDADRLDTENFEAPQGAKLRNNGKYKDWNTLIDMFEEYLNRFKSDSAINQIRAEISDACLKASSKPSGIFRLTVPTGGGKTLSSLRFALHHAREHKMDRIIYVVPYNTIIEQNASVVRSVFDKLGDLDSVLLEHHSYLSPEEKTYRHQLLCEAWDAPIVFTSMVQFMDTLFGGGTKTVRRMHALANSVIIFDEIQSLPIKCVQLFNVAARFLSTCCHGSLVLCTATQPLLHAIEPKERALPQCFDRQIVPDEEKLYKRLRRVSAEYLTKPNGWGVKDITELAINETANTGSTLIVVNTKEQAHQLFKEVRDQFHSVVHLSTDMCAQHRLNVLDEVKLKLLNKEPVICVSTQLIEAGVDVDFGTAIRYMAGLSSIVQTAGRCNRNGKRPQGKVFIVDPANENLGNLSEIRAGVEYTRRLLDDFKRNPAQFDNDLLGPKAMEWYYRCFFFNRKEYMSYQVDEKSVVGRKGDLFDLLSTNSTSRQYFAEKNKNTLPPYIMLQSFRSAAQSFRVIDDITRAVLVPYERGKEIIQRLCSSRNLVYEKELLMEAQRYTVNVYPNVLEKLHRVDGLHEVQKESGILYLIEGHYSKEFGVSIGGSPLETLTL